MTTTAVQRFYKFHALIYDKTRWMILHGRRGAAEQMGLRGDSSVLEVGCGTGLNFRFVQERIDPQRSKLVGLDFSQDMLRVAEKRVAAAGWPNVELVHGDATQLRLGRQFDAILFGYSLTMIPDWRAALRCAREHLKPAARLVVLDFGRFAGWGPFGGIMRGWLRLNHVETLAPYVEYMRELFPNLEVSQWLGGYCFTAVGRRAE